MAKKIRGKTQSFGRDKNAALQKYFAEKDRILAGLNRQPIGCDMAYLVNSFLNSKESDMKAGYITDRTFNDYYSVGRRLLKHMGRTTLVESIGPADFEQLRAKLGKGRGPNSRGPVSLKNDIIRIRTIFKYGAQRELIPRPVNFGDQFKVPPKKLLRRAKNLRGPCLFSAIEIQQILTNALPNLKAMIYLGINSAFGPTDCATLPITAVNLETSWVNHPRPKTEVERRCPLWPETIAAIEEVLNSRLPKHKSVLVFLTQKGRAFDTVIERSISKEFCKQTQACGFHRKGVGFYGLRHTFFTIAEPFDKVAASIIMGHAPDSRDMAAVYRECIDDARLKAVVNHVRDWLFAKQELRVVG